MLLGFEGAADVAVDAMEGLAVGIGVIEGTTFSFSVDSWTLSEVCLPFPDNRRDRFWIGPALAEALLWGTDWVGSLIKAVSDSVGIDFSLISVTMGIERGTAVFAGIDVEGAEEVMGGPRKVAETGDGGVAGVRRTVGGVRCGEEVWRLEAAISRLIPTRDA